MSADKASKNAKMWHDSYAKLHNVLGKRGVKNPDLQAAFGRLAKELAKGKCESGTLQVVIGGGSRRESWVLESTASGCQAKQGTAYAPRFEVVARRPAVQAMLSGEIAPIAAIARGDMRVRGDLEFGKTIYKLLAADKGRIDPCP